MSGSGWEPARELKRTRNVDRGGGGWEPWGAAGGSSSMSASDLRITDGAFLDCSICSLPLKPPVFECAVGHVLCSVCCDKLKEDTRGCSVCSVAVAGGYRRCHAMERVVDSVRAVCPHAPYGCYAVPLYYEREKHLRECPHAPCHCPAGAACGFVGSTAALLDHIASAHGDWPCVTRLPSDDRGQRHLFRSFRSRCHFSDLLSLRDGFNFVVPGDHDESGRKYIFLLNVVCGLSDRAVSAVCIRPCAAATKEIQVELEHKWLGGQRGRYDQRAEFRVPSSDLSDGLPDPNQSLRLIVPKWALGDDDQDGLLVRLEIRSHAVSDDDNSCDDYCSDWDDLEETELRVREW